MNSPLFGRRVPAAMLCVLGLALHALAHVQLPETSPAERARLLRWREALELDELSLILSEGPALVTGSGALSDDVEAVALVARALFRAGRLAAAKGLLDGTPGAPHGTAAGTPPGQATSDRAPLDLVRASIALAEDDLSETLRILLVPGAREPRHPDYPAAWMLVGRALARAGDLEASELFLVRGVELAPHSAEAPGAWYVLAQSALRRGDLELARERRKRAEAESHWQAVLQARRRQVRESPAAIAPRLELARLWIEASEPDRARPHLVQLIEGAPADSPERLVSLLLIARLDQASGASERAREWYRRYREAGGEEKFD